MKLYGYWEMISDGMNEFFVGRLVDEVEILDLHWDKWCEAMSLLFPKFRKDEMDFLAKSHCIEEWIFLNNAEERQ